MENDAFSLEDVSCLNAAADSCMMASSDLAGFSLRGSFEAGDSMTSQVEDACHAKDASRVVPVFNGSRRRQT